LQTLKKAGENKDSRCAFVKLFKLVASAVYQSSFIPQYATRMPVCLQTVAKLLQTNIAFIQ